MATGGSIQAVTLDGREFAVAADADVARFLGGFKNEVKANGNKTARIVKMLEPWHLNGIVLAIDDNKGDAEFIKALAQRGDFWPVDITEVDGTTYMGVGTLTGDIDKQTQSETMSISLSGEGDLSKQGG